MFTECPGLYCGRIKFDNGSVSQCSSCPDGYRSASSFPHVYRDILPSQCLECDKEFSAHDWLYLGFMALALLVFYLYINDCSVRRLNLPCEVLVLHICSFTEVFLASLLTLMYFSTPFGSMRVKVCGVYRLSDWYTMFFNPSINFKETLRCSQEAVYPMNRMIYFFLMVAWVLSFSRCCIAQRLPDKKSAIKTWYLSLYVFPAFGFCHWAFSGLIYYCFPFITLVGSIISVACHFAFRLDQSMKALFVISFYNTRNVSIILGHWMLHAYGIVSLTKLKSPLHFFLLSLTPIPSIFYILTSKFTNPRAQMQ